MRVVNVVPNVAPDLETGIAFPQHDFVFVFHKVWGVGDSLIGVSPGAKPI